MYLRLLQMKVKTENFPAFQNFYNEKIIPALQKIPGCQYGSLMQSTQQRDECISMTLWDSAQQAEAYEKGGSFQKLLDEAKPYFSDSTEWKVQLSKDLKLEYEPVPEEPVVKSYDVALKISEEMSLTHETNRMYVRFVSVKIRPDKHDELKKIYETEILPALRKVKGCRYAYLTEGIQDPNEGISVTIWDRKEDADQYEASGLFEKLKEKAKHTFSGLYQWKMALEKKSHGQVATSEDLNVTHYSIVAGKSFQ